MGLSILFLIPVLCGAVYWLLTSVTIGLFLFRKRERSDNGGEVLSGSLHSGSFSSGNFPSGNFPFVSVIKPVCGLEPNLYENLATILSQDYPHYEVLFTVQNTADPSLSVLKKLAKDYPEKNIEIVIDEKSVGPNGRLANIYNGAKRAKGEVLVFSDSDMILRSDYLKTIVAPLADKTTGMVCTLYKAVGAKRWFETSELLSFNADFVPAMIFATVTKTGLASPGSSQAIRREVLEKIGGLEPLGRFLVEDYELGRRVVEAGFRMKIIPYIADTQVFLKSPKEWWRHQIYWDQNTRAAAPVGFFFTLFIRGLPFAFLYTLAGGVFGPEAVAGVLGMRFGSAILNAVMLKDDEGLKGLWLLPLRDVCGLFTWLISFLGRSIYWKGRRFKVKKGEMVEVI